jgi:N-acetylglutamate synthase-like GNAT family acetyltransferase
VKSGEVVGAFGVFAHSPESVKLNWILLAPAAQGSGIGSAIVQRVPIPARGHGARSIPVAANPVEKLL